MKTERKKEAVYVTAMKKKAEPWNENLSWAQLRSRQGRVVIDHTSYQKAADLLMRQIEAGLGKKTPKTTISNGRSEGLELGGLFFYQARFPHLTDASMWRFGPPSKELRFNSLDIWNRGVTQGEMCFTGDVFIPILSSSTTTWMSYTLAEVMSQNSGIRAAKGTNILGGLGLGWLARRVLEKKGVKKVVVVERNEALLSAFGKSLMIEHGDRVELVHGDAIEYAKEHGDGFDAALMDIWPGVGEGKEDRDWLSVKSELELAGVRCWEWA